MVFVRMISFGDSNAASRIFFSKFIQGSLFIIHESEVLSKDMHSRPIPYLKSLKNSN